MVDVRSWMYEYNTVDEKPGDKKASGIMILGQTQRRWNENQSLAGKSVDFWIQNAVGKKRKERIKKLKVGIRFFTKSG